MQVHQSYVKTYYTNVKKILKDKKNKWSTMAGTFNTSFRNRNNIKAPGIKSCRGNLREMLFDGQIIKLRFNPR